MSTPQRYAGPHYFPTTVQGLTDLDLVLCYRSYFTRYIDGDTAHFEIAEFGNTLIEEMKHRNLEVPV